MNLFDPDTSVLNRQPQEVTYPLMAFVEVGQCSPQAQQVLPPATRQHPKVLVVLTAYDDESLPFMVKVLQPDYAPPLWIPWQACTPELTLRVN